MFRRVSGQGFNYQEQKKRSRLTSPINQDHGANKSDDRTSLQAASLGEGEPALYKQAALIGVPTAGAQPAVATVMPGSSEIKSAIKQLGTGLP